MNFDWPKEDQEFYRAALEFGRSLPKDVQARDQEQRFGVEHWKRCGDFGLLGLSIPKDYGGSSLGALQTAHMIEAFGRGCDDEGLVFSASAHLLACAMPIVEYASDELRQKYLPGLAKGDLVGANAISEAGSGSDAFALAATAVRDGDSYILNGDKSYVTNGPIADVFLVYASTSPEDGYLGISAFLVSRDTAGVEVGSSFEKMGLRTSPTCPVRFDECRVSVRQRLGPEGEGAKIFARSMTWERACLFAGYIGAMERQLDATITYAQDRRQFRRAIGRHQAVAHRIADMKLRLESARLLLYRACWEIDQGSEATLAVCLSKLAISEAAIQSSLDAIQVHGGIGYVTGAGVERSLRDAVPATIFSGTSEVLRGLVARELGL